MKTLVICVIFFAALNACAAVHQIAQLSPANTNHVTGAAADSIAISADGNTIVIGNPGAIVGRNYHAGAVYVFVKPAGGWTNMSQTATLTASDGLPGTYLGSSVAISGDTIVAGAQGIQSFQQGKAYVFVKPAGGWKNATQNAELAPSDGVAQDLFGASVSISGNTIVASAPAIDNNQGAAYVFVKPQGGWTNMTETTKLTASDGQPGDFMQSVAIQGDLILAGASHLYNQTTPGAGYIFEGSGSTWTQIAKLTSSDWILGESFGGGGPFNGNTVVLGEYSQQPPFSTAYVFVEPPTGWANMTETAELNIQDSTNLGFGAGAISANGSAILANAWNDNGGTAFVFLKPKSGWATTSTPNITFGSGDGFDGWMAIGNPGIAALVAHQSTGPSYVLLFAQ